LPWAAINVFEREHVIRAEWRAGAHWYELTHDRFIGPIGRSNRGFLIREITGLRGKGRAVPLVLERRGGLARKGRQRATDPVPGGHPDVSEERPEPGVALCLTGGGYRSMLFSAGVLWRLHDTGYLQRLRQVSSNSAAAIAAGLVGLSWDRLGPDAAFDELVVAPLRELASTRLDTKVALSSLLRRHNGNAELAAEYRRHVFGSAMLAELPDSPRFVFTASHLASGELWRFEKHRMGNERSGWTDRPDVPIAVAIAASGATPPVLSPAVVNGNGSPSVVLTSGALFDTLALETAWRRFDTVLVSDAKGSRPVAHMQRGRLSHFMDFVAASDTELHHLRRQQALLAYTTGVKSGSYWSINSELASFPVEGVLPCPPEKTAELAAVPGRLSRLDDRLQERLVNWGYAVTDAALRAHVDRTIEPPQDFPFSRTGIG